MRSQSRVAAVLALVPGGTDAVKDGCRVGDEAIKKWHQAGRIPPKHWPILIELSQGEVTLAMLNGRTMRASAPAEFTSDVIPNVALTNSNQKGEVG